MNKVILFFLLLNTSISMAQSKKEQIETLQLRIDSLNSVMYSERNTSNHNIISLNSKISVLEINNDSLRLLLNNIKDSLYKKELEFDDLNIKYDKINNDLVLLKTLIDSLKKFQPIITEVINNPDEIITVDKYKSINDFGFEKYNNASNSKLNTKSILNVNSNSFTKEYKTRVTEFYKNAEVNFSGKYTVIYWDAGMGTTLGTLIDCSTGIAYDIPINDETAFIGCFDENKLKTFESIFGRQKVFFNNESNLLVLRSCDQYNNDGIIFRFYIWNEEIKKFKLLKIEKNVF
jgi:hypothetical protein